MVSLGRAIGLDEVAKQLLGEIARIGVAQERGKAHQVIGPLWQFVRLSIADHLQPVLDSAQEAIGGTELAGGAAWYVAHAIVHIAK